MQDKVILITGGTSGIGKAAATEFARQGARVVITSRDRIRGDNTIDEIREADTIVRLASSPEIEGVTGKYFTNRKELKSDPGSYNKDVWKRLWEVSAELTGI